MAVKSQLQDDVSSYLNLIVIAQLVEVHGLKVCNFALPPAPRRVGHPETGGENEVWGTSDLRDTGVSNLQLTVDSGQWTLYCL